VHLKRCCTKVSDSKLGEGCSKLNEKQAEWYDQLYSGEKFWSTFAGEDAAHILDAGLRYLRKRTGINILEVGCGVGAFLTEARRNGISDLVGTDLSSAALHKAKSSLNDSEFVVADGLHLPFKEKVFEIVACLGTLEHFDDPSQGAREFYRTLTIGGSCLVVVPNPYFAYTIVCKVLGRYRYQPIEHDLSVSNWENCLQGAGFVVLNVAVSNPRSDCMLTAKSIPMLAKLYPTAKPLLSLYDAIRHHVPKLFSYHIMFVTRRIGTGMKHGNSLGTALKCKNALTQRGKLAGLSH